MPAPRQEVELLGPGMDVSTPVKRMAWIQNMWKPRGAWKTRPGFGVLAQIDCDLRSPAGMDVGFQKHLGSYLFRTSIGHDQIVSVFLATVSSSNARETDAPRARWAKTHVVSIYDVTTRTIWQEPLWAQSSQYRDMDMPMENRHAVYESSAETDYQAVSVADDAPFSFAVVSDILYFGSRTAGLWGYIPTVFGNTRRNMGLDLAVHFSEGPGYGESGCVTKIPIRQGLFASYTYLSPSVWPTPDVFCDMGNRLAIGSGKTLYFTDQNFPGVIVAENFLDIPSRENISAMKWLGDTLVILAGLEMFCFIPTSGYIISGGLLKRVSSEIGCLSQSAMTLVSAKLKSGSTVEAGSLVWCDPNGVYLTRDGLGIKTLSDPIKPFFRDSITNPLTSYYPQSGFVDPGTEPPRSRYDFTDPGLVNLAYDQKTNAIFLSVPNQNLVWVYQDGWHLWNFESCAYSADVSQVMTPKVKGVNNINNPWMLSGGGRIFLVGGMDVDNWTYIESSYYILEMGRGGSLDRSIGAEDYRLGGQQWWRVGVAAGGYPDAGFYLGAPEQLPVKSYHTEGFPASTATSDGTHYRVPVYLDTRVAFPGALGSPWELQFEFVSADWEVLRAAPGSPWVKFLVPSESLNCAGGYLLGASYTCDVGGAPNAAVTNRVRFVYDHAGVELANLTLAVAVVPDTARTPILYLLFKRKTTGALRPFGIVDKVLVAKVLLTDVNVWENRTTAFNPGAIDTDKSQAVDWAIKGQQVGIGGQQQVFARGVVARMLSRGKGSTRLVTNWIWGPYNTLLGSDWKDWVSGVFDYQDDIVAISDKETVRARHQGVALTKRVFNGAEKWGTTADATKGNTLVDEEQIDTITTSDRVRGEHFSYMLFGNILNKAESIELVSAKALFQLLEPRRRDGR